MGSGTRRGNAGRRLRTGPLRSAGRGSGSRPARGSLLPQLCLRGASWSLPPIIDHFGQNATDASFDFDQRQRDDEISKTPNILRLHGAECANRRAATLKQHGGILYISSLFSTSIFEDRNGTEPSTLQQFSVKCFYLCFLSLEAQ